MDSVSITRSRIVFCRAICSSYVIRTFIFTFCVAVSYMQSFKAITSISVNFFMFPSPRSLLLKFAIVTLSSSDSVDFAFELSKVWFSARVLIILFLKHFLVLNFGFAVEEVQLLSCFQLTRMHFVYYDFF